MSSKNALNQYQQVNMHGTLNGASPHKLIQMLMEGGLQRMQEAKGAMQRGDVAHKGVAIGKAISIVGGLSDSLNLEVEGGISENLESLYAYIVDCLMSSTINNEETKLNEAVDLLKTIKSGWDEIAPAAE